MSPERMGPPPVDGLSDLSWARVERNLFARVDGTVTNAVSARDVRSSGAGRNWVWLAVPAAAAAAFAFAFFTMNGGPSSSQTDGERSRIVAGASPSTVSFGDAHITVEANTAVLLDRAAGKPTAVLEDGAATFAIAPAGAPITVLAGDMTARAANATFTVTRKGERADVSVAAGSVEILFRGNDLKLTASQRWTSERPAEPTSSN